MYPEQADEHTDEEVSAQEAVREMLAELEESRIADQFQESQYIYEPITRKKYGY